MNALFSLEGDAAWRNAASGPARKWADIAARFAADPFVPDHRPKFRLNAEDRFFCLGSCFARNVEEHLIYRGADVLSKQVRSPREEWPYRPNGFLNKFTTHSMLQEIRWLDDAPADPTVHLLDTAQGWRDLHLAPGLGGATLERAVERRGELSRDYFPRLRQADAVVLTLGLNEVWRDLKTDTRLNAAPGLGSVRSDPGRFRLETTSVEQNQAALEEIRDRLKRANPAVRIVVTVSPVPMALTFSGRDIAVANMLSKSTLRAAADAFQAAHDDVDYFPSYEIATLSSRPFAYAEDCLHVADAVVGHIMETFLHAYCGLTPDSRPDFSELAYLDANPDVETLVRRGEIVSGFHHWTARGEAEGRPLRPAAPSDRLRMAGG